jgi:hypothetical protein
MCDSWLYGTVFRQRADKLLTVGYTILCVGRELKCV